MIKILIFSKSGIDFALFRFQHDYELKTILTLEGKTIRNLEHRENVVTGQLEKENEIPIIYDPKADCQKTKQFFKEVIYKADIPVIQEFFGYCLYRRYHIHKSCLFMRGFLLMARELLFSFVVRLKQKKLILKTWL